MEKNVLCVLDFCSVECSHPSRGQGSFLTKKKSVKFKRAKKGEREKNTNVQRLWTMRTMYLGMETRRDKQ